MYQWQRRAVHAVPEFQLTSLIRPARESTDIVAFCEGDHIEGGLDPKTANARTVDTSMTCPAPNLRKCNQ